MRILPRLFAICIFVLLSCPAIALQINAAVYSPDDQLLVVTGTAKDKSSSTVELTDSVSGLQLDTTSITGNAFVFKVPFGGIRRAPCEVSVSVEADSASSAVQNAPEHCSHLVFQITGTVDSPFAPGASIEAMVEDYLALATADTSGAFSVELAAVHASSVITLFAFPAPEAELTAHSTGNSGNGLALSDIAGPVESFLTSSPNTQLALSPSTESSIDSNTTDTTIDAISTARWALLGDTRSEEFQTTDELIEAEKTLSASELLELAAVIKLIMDDPNFDLPADQDDMLSFATDPVAVDQFIADVTADDPNDNELTQMEDTILAEAALENAFDAATLPPVYLEIPATVAGFIARQGEILQLNADGTGAVRASFGGSFVQDPYSWSVVSGDLVVTFDSPLTDTDFPLVEDTTATEEQKQLLNDDGVHRVTRNFATTERSYVLVSEGVLVDIASKVVLTEITYDPVTLSDGTVVQIAPTESLGSGEVELRDAGALTPIAFTESLVSGQRWSMMTVYDPGESFWEAGGFFVFGEGVYGDLLFFNADAVCAGGTCTGGTGYGEVSERPFSWEIDEDGRLHVFFGNGDSMSVTLLETNGTAYGTLYDFDRASGKDPAHYALAIKQDPSLQLTAASLGNPPGEFWNALVNAWSLASYGSNGELRYFFNFGWTFSSDGTATNQSFFIRDADGDGTEDRIRSVRYLNWTAEIDGSARAAGEWWGACLGTGTDCHRRHWTPLAETAEGDLYVFEQADSLTWWRAPADQQWLPHLTGRINRFHRQPFVDSDFVWD